MNAQLGEVFRMDNAHYMIAETPLSPLFSQIKTPPHFIAPSAQCQRGYFGKWELIGDALYMTGFRGFFEDHEEVDLNFLFPQQEYVFAEWFSGIITIPFGQILHFKNTEYAAIYEEDILLCFDCGMMVDYDLFCNRKTHQPALFFIE